MRLDQLDGIVAFVTVAQKRSFTAAAAQLEVTPPAVSLAVKSLEARLGVRLLHRTTRSVGLTEAGERYYAQVAPAMADVLAAGVALDEFRDQPAGTLRLTLPRSTLPLLAEGLREFMARYPQIRLELSQEDRFVDIAAQGFDAGIRLGESVEGDMVAMPLMATQQVAIVGSPGYFAQHVPPRRIEDLRQHRCIRYRFQSTGAIYRWELLRNGREVEVEIDGPLTVSDSASMPWLAEHGFGLAYTFSGLVEAAVAQGRLIPVLQAACPTWPGFYLYYPSRRQLPAKLRCLIDFWREWQRTPPSLQEQA
ncbi:LysR family transcriptional regulator [Chitinolyticbacter meiyuanensis]|uniref:LysR family transcriptional regulator n=1 Tax=Chitinolyticbacter meiyuanensis TaxID=682798 RepID=UPI0011E5F4C4|nr:LysR family transcriptional regulator [Chitinolyticbacter meiyuanensis]